MPAGPVALTRSAGMPSNSGDFSQIPVVDVTGRAPGWPGALKLPGAAVY